jgi:hypothetical protein
VVLLEPTLHRCVFRFLGREKGILYFLRDVTYVQCWFRQDNFHLFCQNLDVGHAGGEHPVQTYSSTISVEWVYFNLKFGNQSCRLCPQGQIIDNLSVKVRSHIVAGRNVEEETSGDYHGPRQLRLDQQYFWSKWGSDAPVGISCSS